MYASYIRIVLELWSLLVLVVAVGAGLVTVTVSSLLARSRQTALFRYLLIQVLLFNLLILFGLGVRYLEIESRETSVVAHPALIPVLVTLMAPLKLGWLYAFAAMMLVLPGQELPARFRSRYARFAAAFFGAWVILLLGGPLMKSADAILAALLGSMELVVIGGGIAACVHLLIRSRALAGGLRRRSVMILGSAYLGIFATMVGSLTLGWIRPAGQTGSQLLVNSLVMVIYNLVSLVWILRFQPTGPFGVATATERYGISAREWEITELLCAGCTNQEIADRLFISPATVKDHVYNVFRKTGVRNRVELTNLMRVSGKA